MRKLTQEEVRQWFLDRGSDLYSEYKSAKSPVVFKCSLCGGKGQYGTWNLMTFRNKECWCSECREKKRVQGSIKYTYEEVKKILNDRGVTLLFYTDSHSRLEFTCKLCGEKTSRYSIMKLMRDKDKDSTLYCEKCIHTEIYKTMHVIPVEEVKEWFLKKGSELIEYKDSQSEVWFRCSICNKKARYTNYSLLKKVNPLCRCKKCSFLKIGKERLLDVNTLKDFFKERGSVLLTYLNYQKPIKFTCSCCKKESSLAHIQCLLRRKNLNTILCESCYAQEKIEIYKKEIIIPYLNKLGCQLIQYEGSKKPIKMTCARCDKIFEYFSFLSLIASKSKGFCKDCFFKSISGENNPRWDSSITEEERGKTDLRRISPQYSIWTTKIKNLFQNRCAITSEEHVKKDRHHLYSFLRYRKLRLFFWNGVLIKKEIHKLFHSKYGLGKNTFPQFQKFCKENFGLDFYISLTPSVVFDILETWDEGLIESKRIAAEAKGLKYFCFLERYVLKHPERVNYAILSESNRLDLLEKPFHFKTKHLRGVL